MTQEQYVAVYSFDSRLRCVVTWFEFLALARRPHAPAIEQLDIHTFRLRMPDDLWSRVMLPISEQKRRLIFNHSASAWNPPVDNLNANPTHIALRDHAERTQRIGLHEVNANGGIIPHDHRSHRNNPVGTKRADADRPMRKPLPAAARRNNVVQHHGTKRATAGARKPIQPARSEKAKTRRHPPAKRRN